MRFPLAIMLAVAASAATAAQPYAGLEVGITKADYSSDDFTHNLGDGSFTSANTDSTDTAFRLIAGANINDVLAAELTYMDNGKVNSRATSSGGFVYSAGTVDSETKATAFALSLKGTYWLNPAWGIYGKAGLSRWSVDTTVANNGTPILAGSDDGTDPIMAIGAEYKMGNVSFRADLERDFNVADVDVDIFGLAATYQFQ